MKRSRISPTGKKGREWANVRRQIIAQLERQGIVYCEFGFDGCTRNDYLSLAHSMKRRFLGSGDDRKWRIREVALACWNCHRILDEVMSHEEMAEAVREAIAARRDAA